MMAVMGAADLSCGFAVVAFYAEHMQIEVAQ